MEYAKDIRKLNDKELEAKVVELKNELFDLRFKQATGAIESPARIREIRKTIARIKTVQTERLNSND